MHGVDINRSVFVAAKLERPINVHFPSSLLLELSMPHNVYYHFARRNYDDHRDDPQWGHISILASVSVNATGQTSCNWFTSCSSFAMLSSLVKD